MLGSIIFWDPHDETKGIEEAGCPCNERVPLLGVYPGTVILGTCQFTCPDALGRRNQYCEGQGSLTAGERLPQFTPPIRTKEHAASQVHADEGPRQQVS